MRSSGRWFSNRPVLLDRATGILPSALKDAAVRHLICSDRASRRDFRAAHSRGASGPVPIHLRALGGAPVWIRPGSDDPWILRELVTYGDLWPPTGLGEPRLIVDLGANIGISMALFANAFPAARIIGVEPDPANAELCKRNIRPWRERCELVEAAVWTEDGTASLVGGSAAAFRIAPEGGGRRVSTISMDGLVDRFAADGPIDYVKVDIEGAERQLLGANTAWSSRVRCMSVEVHDPYDVERGRVDLELLGFDVTTKPAPRNPRVVGLRA